MSTHRFLNVSFWQDAFVLDLTPEEKYFYIYLMTNSKTSQIGIYELPYRVIELETGYNRETVSKLINRFIEYEKIEYNPETKEVYVKNWAKYNWNNSEKVISRVKSELENVKDTSFVKKYVDYVNNLEKNNSIIQYPYSMDSLWNKEKEKKEKESKEKEKIKESDSDESESVRIKQQFEEWWALYNKKVDKKKAESKFKKCVKQDSFEDIMAGTRKYIATIRDKQYQKHPTTFLNGENYKDDYDNAQAQQTDNMEFYDPEIHGFKF